MGMQGGGMYGGGGQNSAFGQPQGAGFGGGNWTGPTGAAPINPNGGGMMSGGGVRPGMANPYMGQGGPMAGMPSAMNNGGGTQYTNPGQYNVNMGAGGQTAQSASGGTIA